MITHGSLHLVLEAEQVPSGLRTLEACGIVCVSRIKDYGKILQLCSGVSVCRESESS